MAEQKEQKQLTLKEQNEIRSQRQKYLKFLKEENELMENQIKYYQYQIALPRLHAEWENVTKPVAEDLQGLDNINIEQELAPEETLVEETPIVEFKQPE